MEHIMTDQLHTPFARMTNLADARLGAEAIHCTDDYFADMNRMLQSHDPVWKLSLIHI